MANEPTAEASGNPSDAQAVGRTQQPFVGPAEPNEFEARSIDEALRAEVAGVYGIGAQKRLQYASTLWPEWVSTKRKQVRLELFGDESNPNFQSGGTL